MLGIYRKEDALKDDELDPPGRAAKKVKPELMVKRELLLVLPLGALSFVLWASFSKEVARVSGSMMNRLCGTRLEKAIGIGNKEVVQGGVPGREASLSRREMGLL